MRKVKRRIKVRIKELEAISHLVTDKLGEIERLPSKEIALRLGGSKQKIRDLENLAVYLRQCEKKAQKTDTWAQFIELKEEELEWILMFLREELGLLVRGKASYYGILELRELEKLTEYLEEQKEEATVVL